MADHPGDFSPRARLIANSRAMRHVLELCRRVAPTRTTVLITGETGTGKEIVARYIHRHSPRRDRPMVVFNCGGGAQSLIESELFGHERGAFTGAILPRAGVFERADGGSLLLDEVGDMPLGAQAKLLRVLQERRFSRLGGTASHDADVRVIATTHGDLLALSGHGKFREDLVYRLNAFPIHMPPLRERREEIAPLATHFLESVARQNRSRQSGISDAAMALLISYHWPGNVRQLQSIIERGLLLSMGEPILETHLPTEIVAGYVPPVAGEAVTSLSYAQRLIVARALFEHNWNFTSAAQRLGVTTHVLRQLAAKLGVRRSV
ncbi:MAG: sigma-54 dependent transcriptional regulator [Phycisphaerae bacterium]